MSVREPEKRGARRCGYVQLLSANFFVCGDRLGYSRAIIPWTDAINYYRKGCGARVEQQFVILRRIAP